MNHKAGYRKNRTTLFTFFGLLGLALFINFKMMAPYLLAILVGGILAMVSAPFYRRLLKRNFSPKLAAGTVTLGVGLLLLGPTLSFTAIVVDQGVDFANTLSQYEGFSLPTLNQKLTQLKPIRTLVGDKAAVDKQIRDGIQSFGKAASAWILAAVSKVPDLFLQLLLGIFACFFLLLDSKRLFLWTKDKLPLDPEVRETLFASFKDTAVSAIWATLAAATVQAALMFVSFLALGIPVAFLAAGATFFFAWIPIVGSTPVWLGGAVYLYSQGNPGKMAILLLMGVVTGLSDNVVYPWMLKGRGNLHPMVGLVAIFGGIHMFGVLGVFLGPILAALLISLLKILPDIRRKFGLVGDGAGAAAAA
jgi:predicted PurR-regulated permease PerM